MSGGYFDYQEYRINDIAESIRLEYIKGQRSSYSEGEFKKKLPKEILAEMFDLYQSLELSYKRIHDLDYFLSGDHSEDTYLKHILCIGKNLCLYTLDDLEW